MLDLCLSFFEDCFDSLLVIIVFQKIQSICQNTLHDIYSDELKVSASGN